MDQDGFEKPDVAKAHKYLRPCQVNRALQTLFRLYRVKSSRKCILYYIINDHTQFKKKKL